MTTFMNDEMFTSAAYAGLPSARVNQLEHSHHFDPEYRSKGRPSVSPEGLEAGIPSTRILKSNSSAFSSNADTKVRITDAAGTPSILLNQIESSKKVYNLSTNSEGVRDTMLPVEPDNVLCPVVKETQSITDCSRRVQRDFRRRLASEIEETKKFGRAYICTDNRSGRTEIMTTRRPGAAHLDLAINRFDVYASHAGHRLVGQPEKSYNRENLKNNLLPVDGAEGIFRPGRGCMAKSAAKVQFQDGFLTAKPEPRQLQALGYVRRKIDARWSRSNRSSFGLADGYDPMIWDVPPTKPMINTSFAIATGNP